MLSLSGVWAAGGYFPHVLSICLLSGSSDSAVLFLLPVCIPMGVILWPRETAGKTHSRLEPSLNLGALLDLDLLTVAPKGARSDSREPELLQTDAMLVNYVPGADVSDETLIYFVPQD